MKYKTPNNFGELIIEELQKEKYVGGETIYQSIANKLGDECTFGFRKPIKKDLDFLTEQGIIVRYDRHRPEKPNAEIDFLCDELIYHLPKKKAKLNLEDIYASDMHTFSPRIA